jgi:cyclopropane fatty-acyl-phospholipid synthase-like methyltransferase
MNTDDLFFDVYDREDLAYGLKPSAELASYLTQVAPEGLAIDLGAGAGRNSLALARAGLRVRAIDMSERGMERLMELAASRGLAHLIQTTVADVREVELPVADVSVMVATTVLDHIPVQDAAELWQRIERSLTAEGVVYAEVHTTEDPGSPEPPGRDNPFPVSETAAFVKHYFAPGELLHLAMKSGEMRVLRYEERQEWDYTHGDEHHHGKAVLLAVRKGCLPAWYGHPLLFPRHR